MSQIRQFRGRVNHRDIDHLRDRGVSTGDVVLTLLPHTRFLIENYPRCGVCSQGLGLGDGHGTDVYLESHACHTSLAFAVHVPLVHSRSAASVSKHSGIINVVGNERGEKKEKSNVLIHT